MFYRKRSIFNRNRYSRLENRHLNRIGQIDDQNRRPWNSNRRRFDSVPQIALAYKLAVLQIYAEAQHCTFRSISSYFTTHVCSHLTKCKVN